MTDEKKERRTVLKLEELLKCEHTAQVIHDAGRDYLEGYDRNNARDVLMAARLYYWESVIVMTGENDDVFDA